MSGDEVLKVHAILRRESAEASKWFRAWAEAQAEIERLRAEVERLRAAGDALAQAAVFRPQGSVHAAIAAWQEARRG